MKLRSFIASGVALGLIAAGAGLATTANAAVVDADVGGAAAGIQAIVTAQNFSIFPRLLQNNDMVRLSLVTPRVELGRNGGTHTAAVVNQTVGPVNVRAMRATITGNRQGNPFAEASTSLTGVTIQGTDIRAIQTYCRWDADHETPVATTTIVGAGGTVQNPAPNTEVDLPGLGTLTLNEQYIDHTMFVSDPTAEGGYRYAEVIYVFGAHLRLEQEAQDLYGAVDIVLGYTSCDPLVLPNLSGLKLLQTST